MYETDVSIFACRTLLSTIGHLLIFLCLMLYSCISSRHRRLDWRPIQVNEYMSLLQGDDDGFYHSRKERYDDDSLDPYSPAVLIERVIIEKDTLLEKEEVLDVHEVKV